METKYHKDDFSLKQWSDKIDEEEARWRHIGISLDNLQMSGSNLFKMQAQLQAIINCLAEGDTSEENLQLHLKMIVFASMEEVRIELEPQIARMKLTQGITPAGMPPNIIMPWLRKEDNGG